MLAAFPGFFLSAFFVYLLLPVLGERLGVLYMTTINYVDAMLITFIIWVAVAPLAALGASFSHYCNRRHKD
jgi:hypothetical protein